MSGEKRPSADPGKKAKNPKKKKKKDPNEPQKPVSAYALFFRDTQAAIKGQNPSATFGDVSKIVASMWDSLGEEQKQVSPHPFLGRPSRLCSQTWKVWNQVQPLELGELASAQPLLRTLLGSLRPSVNRGGRPSPIWLFCSCVH